MRFAIMAQTASYLFKPMKYNSTLQLKIICGGDMAEKEQMVLAALQQAGKPLRPGDVAELTGLDKEEVAKIINTLKKEGKVTSPKRCFWAPAN